MTSFDSIEFKLCDRYICYAFSVHGMYSREMLDAFLDSAATEPSHVFYWMLF